MLLVDSSVWIDHFRTNNPVLSELLSHDMVATHQGVIEEISLGNLSRRGKTLGFLENLTRIPAVTHEEFVITVRARKLWGRGLGAIDVHLLAAAIVTPGVKLWTRDKRLQESALELGVAFIPQSH